MNAGNPVAKKGAATSLGFDIRVTNNAPPGVAATINPATPNYAVDFYFAQADLTVSPTATKTAAFPASTGTGNLNVGLTQGQSTLLTPMTVTATVPSVNCPQYTWACTCVKKGSAATFIDLDLTNNCQCLDATTLISCTPGKV
jgi:hypothetical protein